MGPKRQEQDFSRVEARRCLPCRCGEHAYRVEARKQACTHATRICMQLHKATHTHSYLSRTRTHTFPRTAGSCSGSAHTVHASSQCAVCARHDLRHFATPL